MSERNYARIALATLACIVLAAGLVATLLAPAGPARAEDARTAHKVAQTAPRWMTRPCAEEDSVNCFWDAGESGNGMGHSFYVRQFPSRARMICVMYVDASYARRHDYCEATR